MTQLVLNRRQNYRNVQLAADTRAEQVGYLLPGGERRFVAWLGFIERREARCLRGARPVRLVEISRVGYFDGVSVQWENLPASTYVHGCLTEKGAYALYDATVVMVGEPEA